MKKRLYSIWHNMKTRCYTPGSSKYKYYGGRGITVCDEWRNNFPAFYKWAIENGYREDLTIDRKNVNGNYDPSNCQWVDRVHQNNNTRKNHYIVFNGETRTAAEWARKYGISRNLLNVRVRRGWPIEEALFLPAGKRRKKKMEGK